MAKLDYPTLLHIYNIITDPEIRSEEAILLLKSACEKYQIDLTEAEISGIISGIVKIVKRIR